MICNFFSTNLKERKYLKVKFNIDFDIKYFSYLCKNIKIIDIFIRMQNISDIKKDNLN